MKLNTKQNTATERIHLFFSYKMYKEKVIERNKEIADEKESTQ